VKKNINIFKINEKGIIIFLFLFSLLINQYYGNRGVFPPDSFAHFDNGFRILLGEYPFKDYWVVSGPLIDYLQAIFFYIFGVSWFSHVLHGSLLNVILTVATFFILRNFKLNIYYSFFYSLSFSILAYPSSGTPFVDHHSAFFSLLGIYSLILAVKTEKKIYWILLPIFLGSAFFSKQVPSSYVIISTILILLTFVLFQKKINWIKYSLISSIAFILLIAIFGKIQGINLTSFFEQYIFYPQTIGESRFETLAFTFGKVVGHFKFIYIVFLPLLYINLRNILINKNYFKKKDFLYFLCMLFFTLTLIFHQLLTKNQTFIFFLIPILAAFSQIYLETYKLNFKKSLYIVLIIVCLFSTFKYHLRFNEDRKFHELNNVNFQLTIRGNEIDKKLSGLKWISPQFKDDPAEEIRLIKDIKSHLENDSRNKMVMTHYLFYSTILNQKFFSPSRWLLSDGSTHPLKGNRYYISYKSLLINIIKRNKIKVIYIVDPVEKFNIYNYVNEDCYEEKRINKILNMYNLKKCNEING